MPTAQSAAAEAVRVRSKLPTEIRTKTDSRQAAKAAKARAAAARESDTERIQSNRRSNTLMFRIIQSRTAKNRICTGMTRRCAATGQSVRRG